MYLHNSVDSARDMVTCRHAVRQLKKHTSYMNAASIYVGKFRIFS